MDKKAEVKNLAFIKTMEQRQVERKARWEKLQQKYKEIEEEKERTKKEEEEKLQAEEAEKRRLLLEEKKNKKLLEKQKIEEKERRKQEDIEKNHKAHDHYRLSLMKYKIFIPLRMNLECIRLEMENAKQFYERKLMNKSIIALKTNYEQMKMQKVIESQKRIERFENKLRNKCMKRVFYSLRLHTEMKQNMYEEAENIDKYKMNKVYFILWKERYIKQRELRLLKVLEREQIASKLGRQFNLRFYLTRWKQYVTQLKVEQEMTIIGKELKSKVNNWLNEFRSEKDIEW